MSSAFARYGCGAAGLLAALGMWAACTTSDAHPDVTTASDTTNDSSGATEVDSEVEESACLTDDACGPGAVCAGRCGDPALAGTCLVGCERDADCPSDTACRWANRVEVGLVLACLAADVSTCANGCVRDPSQWLCPCSNGCRFGCTTGRLGDTCALDCADQCPEGMSCSATTQSAGQDPQFGCAESWRELGRPCQSAADCTSDDERVTCRRFDDNGSFCTAPCTHDWLFGLTCQDGWLRAPGDACWPAHTAMDASTTCTQTGTAGPCEGTRTCVADRLTACDALLPNGSCRR